MDKPDISVVVPFFNEVESVAILHKKMIEALDSTGRTYELIFVDDGSTDGTYYEMKKLHPLRMFRLRRNYGQTAAIAVGVRESKGEVLVTMDGDLENDPGDINKLLEKIREGYYIVSGWRVERWKGKLFTRRLPSAAANWLISYVTGVELHDHGCALKAYRRDILTRMHLTGDMHRMIAAYAGREGARIAEVRVRFEPRKYGRSKYGLSRTFKVILDIVAFHFFYKYSRRPMHFFGAMGLWSFFIAGIAVLSALYLKIFEGTNFIRTPLPVLIAIFTLIGFQFILMGLLAELISRSTITDIEYDKEE